MALFQLSLVHRPSIRDDDGLRFSPATVTMARKQGTHATFVGDLQERAKDVQVTNLTSNAGQSLHCHLLSSHFYAL
jgi:hypothetical protein